jgi:hypothetical protein
MFGSRTDYLADLLRDCYDVVNRQQVHPDDQGAIVAALVISDGINGLRKALLVQERSTRQTNN